MVRCNRIDQLAKDVLLATMVLLKEKVDFEHAESVIQQQRFVRRLKNVDGAELKKALVDKIRPYTRKLTFAPEWQK